MEVKLYVRTRCHRCNGSGLIDCVYCGGTGYNAYGGQCCYCGGMGTADCPTCNGDGYIEEEEY